jgi:hypothetical protein
MPPDAAGDDVVLRVMISSRGLVDSIEVVRPVRAATEVVVAAVKQWHYIPALVNGKAASVETIVSVPVPLRSSQFLGSVRRTATFWQGEGQGPVSVPAQRVFLVEFQLATGARRRVRLDVAEQVLHAIDFERIHMSRIQRAAEAARFTLAVDVRGEPMRHKTFVIYETGQVVDVAFGTIWYEGDATLAEQLQIVRRGEGSGGVQP